jgi:CheY-like chemotaxis protein
VLSSKPSLLLVDDNPHDCRLVQAALEDLGHILHLKCFADGDSLLSYLRGPRHDEQVLLLLDLNLPVKNGFDIFKELRADERLKSIPVVMWTSSSNPLDIEKAYRLGVSSYVCKPDQYGALKDGLKILASYWSGFATLPSH